MSKFAARATLASMFMGAYAGAMVAIGAVNSNDLDRFDNIVDENGRLKMEAIEKYNLPENLADVQWRHAETTIGNLNAQNPTECGLGAVFTPHAALSTLPRQVKPRQYEREILCRDLFSGDVFVVEDSFKLDR